VLNFSDWQSYDSQRKCAELEAIGKVLTHGSMPLGTVILSIQERVSVTSRSIFFAAMGRSADRATGAAARHYR
jgi:hypothetical protein